MSFQFHGKEFIFTQPDGTVINIKGWGDRHYAVFETLFGFTVVRDPNTGFYRIAKVSEDGDELEPSEVLVEDFDSTTTNQSKSIRITHNSAKAKGKEAFQLLGGRRRCERRRDQYKSMALATNMAGRNQ